MRIRTAFAIITALAVSGLASAQNTLTIGDKAPDFKVAGFVKGDKIDKLEKGKTYVIEFWATWCVPCIQSMPHLSEMAETYKGKIDFVSVNVRDYKMDAAKVPETSDAHVTRVNEWVGKNTEKMRYNVVLDDQKDTIFKSWMVGAGQNGIPCAFIVNDEGNIAWIGHPMDMQPVLKAVEDKTWDVAAYKQKFEKAAADAKAAMEAQKKLVADFKAGDSAAIDAYIEAKDGNKSKNAVNAIAIGMRANPDLAFTYFKKYAHMAPAAEAASWCSLANGLVRTLKTDEDKNDLVAMCGECTAMADPKSAALAYTYHASVLNAVGKKEDAAKWIEKAKAAVPTFEPADQHDGLLNFINQIAKSFEKS